jgi:uncharacterized protein YndB with AHSA1/START domain
LVTTVRGGRERFHYLNPVPIYAIADRWVDQYDRWRVEALADLKLALESAPMGSESAPTFIRTTPERLWQALTDPTFTRRYRLATAIDHGLGGERPTHCRTPTSAFSKPSRTTGSPTPGPLRHPSGPRPPASMRRRAQRSPPRPGRSGVRDRVVRSDGQAHRGPRRLPRPTARCARWSAPAGRTCSPILRRCWRPATRCRRRRPRPGAADRPRWHHERAEMTTSTTDMQLSAMPTVQESTLIRRKPDTVFAAFVGPAITTRFWFTNGNLRRGRASTLRDARTGHDCRGGGDSRSH